MTDTAVDPAAIAADAVALAELDGGTGREQVRIDWLQRRLAGGAGERRVDEAGNLVWTFGPPPYRLAVLAHVDDVFGPDTVRGITERDGWLAGPGIGDNAIAVATTVAVVEQTLAESGRAGPGQTVPGQTVPGQTGPGQTGPGLNKNGLTERGAAGQAPVAVVFTVAEEGLGGLRGARHACRELAPEAVLALEGHGLDRVFTEAVGSLRVRLTVSGPGGHSWWDRGRPSALHELVRLLDELIASASARCPVNVGLAEGGTGVNAIAARASAAVEWRSVEQAELDQRAAELAGLKVPGGLDLTVERLDSRPAGSVPLDHPLVAAVLRARRSVGLPDTTGDGSTDANAALAAGIPALALGCCTGDNMHAPTERIQVASIDTGARQLRAVIREVLLPGAKETDSAASEVRE